MCHEIFDLQFFHDLNPSGPLINRLKYFPIRFRFSRDIQILKSSAVCCTPRSQAPQCASHCRVNLPGVHHTAELSDEQFSPRSQTPQCASFCRVNNLSSVCFNLKFYECYFSVMPKDINMKLTL